MNQGQPYDWAYTMSFHDVACQSQREYDGLLHSPREAKWLANNEYFVANKKNSATVYSTHHSPPLLEPGLHEWVMSIYVSSSHIPTFIMACLHQF